MTTEPAPCPVCEARADVTRPADGDQVTVSCWDCGSFKISGSATAAFKQMSLEGRRTLLDEAKTRAPSGQVPQVKADPAH
jgi:hypothetical protein